MARIPDVERRLLNWARWRLRNMQSGGNFATGSWGERVDCAGWDAPTVIGTNDADAEVTAQAVAVLESRLRCVVESVYLDNRTLAEKARRLCIGQATLYARVDEAHRCISAWYTARAAAQREQAERMQAMARGAQGGGSRQ